MREILFRGKRDDTGEWIEGYFGQSVDTFIIQDYGLVAGHFKVFKVVPETVGQYTGMKDKNGRRIFEGDIIMTHGDAQEAATVFYDDFCFGVDCNYCVLCVTDTDDIEVIGNIHDNPELLKSAGADAAQFADQPVLMSAT